MRDLADADALAAAVRAGRAGADRRRRLHRARGGGGAAREGPRGHPRRGGAAHPRPRRGAGDRRLLPRPPPRATASTIREDDGLERLTGDGRRVTGAILADGTDDRRRPRPRRHRHRARDAGSPREAGLAIDNGVAVDALGRTSDPAIFAAGDCDELPLRAGVRVRLESVPNAIDQAEAVAAAMLGDAERYVRAAVVLVGPVRREAADRRPQRRLGADDGPSGRPAGQPVGLVLAGRRGCSRSTR